MRKYIIRRFLSIIPVLWLVSVIVFALIHLVPGDPVLVILGSSAEAEQIELMRHRLGLDQNIAIQYLRWSKALLRGDLGTSIMSDEPVAKLIWERMPVTISVAAAALLLSLAISLPTGIIAALRHNTYTDYIFMTLVILAVSVPSFWLALLLWVF